jgi:mannose-1-phosphate guanylyltransferase
MANYCVIMAGGSGSRFWPYSLEQKPKQFLDILGVGRSLLQQTYDRVIKIFDTDKILIVSNINYGTIIQEQLPEIKKNNILLEPFKRNTAPCIAYANYKIRLTDENANIVVVPSDHLILKEDEFAQAIQQSLKLVSQKEVLVTLGIKPSRPDTGYGYIQIDTEERIDTFQKVKTFTEKPDIEMAKIFLESGEFFWNAGIFIWSLKAIDKAFLQYLPQIYEKFDANIKALNTEEEGNSILNVYNECPNISIDYGIMEKAEKVYVLCADFGWSDLGTWGSLYENSLKDQNNNVSSHTNTLFYTAKNNIIKSDGKKLIVIQGLDNYIVVDTDKALLICKKQEEQQIRQIVNDIKITKGEEYV